MTHYLTMPLSSQETREIWTPEQFHIANRLNGSYLVVSEYRNEEATEMSFAELRKDYDSSYSNENFEIIAQKNGTVWYEWSFHGVSFKAPQHNNLSDFPREGSVTDVSSDGQEAYITIVYIISTLGGLMLLVIYVAIIIVGLFVGWFLYP